MSAATKTKPAAKAATKPASKAPNAFAGLGDILAGGFDSGLTDDGNDQMVKLAEIEVVAQVREEMEDDQNDLVGLGKSLRKRQLQSILLRPNPAGSAKPYRLVAGERRVRAALIEGLTELRARIKPMTDEQAEDAQFEENVHRKNLTQIEEAKRVQRDLEQLGSVDAVLAKYNKSRAWLSKIVGLLHLPEQAKRLVKENISADVETINIVKTIEKADPKKARELVDELKNSRGKVNARERATAVKEAVKPSKKDKTPSRAGGSVATPRDRRQEEPGQAAVFAGAKKGSMAAAPAEVLGQAYTNIFEFGSSPKTMLDVMKAEDREAVDAWLASFFEAGKQAKDAGRAVIQGLRNGQFAADGAGALALVAFCHGADGHAKFSVLDILGCVKA